MHRKNNVFVLQLETSPTSFTARTPSSGVDAVEDEEAKIEDEMVFKSQEGFRRRA